MSREQTILAREIHAPARKNFLRRQVVTLDIDDLWQIDLVEMFEKRSTKRHTKNKGYKYIMTVIDTFSKYAFAVPLKTKSAVEVTEAMQNVFQNAKAHGHKPPRNMHSDEGKEFFNSKFQDLMKQHKINHYNTFSKLKASIVERFNRTLKEKMWKRFTAENTDQWIDFLQDIVEKYNNTKHRTIGLKPSEVNNKNKHLVLERLRTSKTPLNKSKFHIGDIVRISKSKTIFDKGYVGNWTEELFKIYKVKNTTPVVYLLEDLAGEKLQGSFYNQELKQTKIPDYFRIEKVLETKQNKIKVRWKGYDSRFDSWIDVKNTEKL
jgi:hypothetical protein